MSWDEAFAHRYDEWSADMTADVAFYVGLAREANGPLVELAVGNGRVAVPVAEATGRKVIGIDTSPAMLEQALVRAREARLDGLHQDEPVPHTIRYAVGDNRIDITLDDGGRSSLWWSTKNEWLGLVA